ncbi:Uncharacterized membrane protein YesL [Gracilibacillus kekensis]|uniref:Uncharacterized membrane protein YesL n=2 Tax=Gracilibacillus kekensis TaxID=1027249 RepID=A0A1M7K476_9BACI|nr:Uncharacterized membrane protein YesL [Gracilibacillus kekensis]
MTGVYKVAEWIMRFSVINLLWLTFQLPIVFLVLGALFTEGRSIPLLFTLIAILSPFLLFPATAAMFASVRDWIADREQKSIMQAFSRHYRDNYKVSMKVGFLLTPLWTIIIADVVYLQANHTVLLFAFIVFGVVLYVYTLTVMSVMVHYAIAIRAILKKALFLTFGSPVLFLATIGTSFLIIYVSVNGLPFLLLFFTGSMISFITFSLFYRVYQNITKSGG